MTIYPNEQSGWHRIVEHTASIQEMPIGQETAERSRGHRVTKKVPEGRQVWPRDRGVIRMFRATGRVLSRGGGTLKTFFFICMVCLLDYYSICLSEWKTLFKFHFDVFSVGSQNLNKMCQN